MAESRLTTVVDIQVNNSKALDALYKYNVALQEVADELDALKKKKREEGQLSEEEARQVVMLTEKQKAYRKEMAEMSRQVQNNIIAEGKYADTLKGMGAQLSVAKDTLRSMEMGTQKYGKALEEARAQLAKMEQGTAAYAKQEQAVKKLQRQMDSANEAYKKQEAYVKELNDTMKESEEAYGVFTRNVGNYKESAEMLRNELEGMREGIDGMRTGLDTVTQVMALTGVESEGLEKAVKALTIGFMGFDSVSKLVNSTTKSTILGKLGLKAATDAEAVSTKLATAAQSKSTVVTKAATVAQRALNLVLKANPLLLIVSALVAAAGAIALFATSSEEATEDTKAFNEAQRELHKTIAEGAAANIAGYEKLRHEYAKLRTEKEKTDWIEKNTEAFNNLGLAVANIADAENVFVNNTASVVEAYRRRAEAAALQTKLEELYERRLNLEMQGERIEQVSVGQEINLWNLSKHQRAKTYELGYWEMMNGKAVYTEEGAAAANEASLSIVKDSIRIVDKEIKQVLAMISTAEEAVEKIEEEIPQLTEAVASATTIESATPKSVTTTESATTQSATTTESESDPAEEMRKLIMEELKAKREANQLRVDAATEGSVEEWAARKALLETQYAEELMMRQYTDEEMVWLNQKYAKEMEAIDQEYADRQAEIAAETARIEREEAENTAEIVTSTLGGLSQIINQVAAENKELAKMGKVVALAEIAVETGVAIAKAVSSAASLGFPAALPAIATLVGTVMANISTAISTVQSAQFARGGYVSGPGTATSDDIPARLSNGESVNTALSTSMFGPMLSAFNVMGGGVPIVAQTSAQIAGEEMLARAVAKGVAKMQPVVSVSEINRVSNRVRVVSNLGNV